MFIRVTVRHDEKNLLSYINQANKGTRYKAILPGLHRTSTINIDHKWLYQNQHPVTINRQLEGSSFHELPCSNGGCKEAASISNPYTCMDLYKKDQHMFLGVEDNCKFKHD